MRFQSEAIYMVAKESSQHLAFVRESQTGLGYRKLPPFVKLSLVNPI